MIAGNSIGVRGFEPPTPCSQSMCATRLRHTPNYTYHDTLRQRYCQETAINQADRLKSTLIQGDNIVVFPTIISG